MHERYRLSSLYALLPRARRMQQQACPGRRDGLANSDSTPGLSVGSVRFARVARSSGLFGPIRRVGSSASKITRARKEKRPGTGRRGRNQEGEAPDETSSEGRQRIRSRAKTPGSPRVRSGSPTQNAALGAPRRRFVFLAPFASWREDRSWLRPRLCNSGKGKAPRVREILYSCVHKGLRYF